MTTSTRKTKRLRHAVGAKSSAVGRPVRRIAGRARETRDATDGDDTALGAPLERDVDSVEATQIEAIFEDPPRVDDDAIVDDADSTDARRRE